MGAFTLNALNNERERVMEGSGGYACWTVVSGEEANRKLTRKRRGTWRDGCGVVWCGAGDGLVFV